MKFLHINKNLIISISFIFLISIFYLNILNENYEYYFFNNKNNILLKYLTLILLFFISFFLFYKEKQYKNKIFYLGYLFLFPFLLNGIIGIIFFSKGILCLFISYLLYKCLNDSDIYKILEKVSRVMLLIFFSIYFTSKILAFYSETFFFDYSINHSKDLAIIITFLSYLVIQKKNFKDSKSDVYLLTSCNLIFLYFNKSKTLLCLLLILILVKTINKKYLINLFIMSFILIFTSSLIFVNKTNGYNKFENLFISLDEITSLRISRVLYPCSWSEYRYFKSRSYQDMYTKDNTYKNCPYNKSDKVTLLPIHFLNYNLDYYLDTNLLKNSKKNYFFKLNNISRDYNLDNSFAKYLYFNGLFFFVIFAIVFAKIILYLLKNSKEPDLTIYIILVLTYFTLHAGLFAPGNLLAILLNALLFQSFYSKKNV